MNNNILVIVAHPDDETIGCGATIRKHYDLGDNIYCVAFTNGIGARSYKKLKLKNEVKKRKIYSQNAAKILGFKWINIYNYPDNQLDKISILTLIKKIEKIKEKINPKIIYTHSFNDLNIDHSIIHTATITAFRPQPHEVFSEIRLFEIPSSTDYNFYKKKNIFIPNLFINIKELWKFKEDALNVYKKEIRKWSHTRSLESIKNLSYYRGTSSGLEMAEAFEILKKIER